MLKTIFATATLAVCAVSPLPAAAQSGSAATAATDIRIVWRIKRSNRSSAVRNTTVAVIDTGANLQHADLVGKASDAPWSYFNETGDVTDTVTHGTHVTSVVVAPRSGIAPTYLPTFLPVQVFNGPKTTTGAVAAGLAYAVGRAPIANMSLGSTAAFAEDTFKGAVGAGMLIVAAAGNAGGANPEWPARFAREAWANGQILAVGAVDSSNVIASFSNRAGDTAQYYLVAPGVNVYGAYALDNSSHAYMSGTSAATPQVSAAAAIVRAYWPYLSAQQIARILLVTATDLGDPGADAIYGNGLLNLARALDPVGTLSVPLASGKAVPIGDVSLAPGIATGAAIRAAAASGKMQAIGLDSFGRQYYTDLGQGVAAAPRVSAEQLFGASDRSLAFATTALVDGGRLSYALDAATDLPLGSMHAYETRNRATNALAGFALVRPIAPGHELAFGTLGYASSYFGLGAIEGLGAPALANPHLGLVSAASHLALGSELGAGFKLKYGVLASDPTGAMLTQFGFVGRPAARATAGALELARAGQAGMLGLAVSHVRETDAYLGSVGSSAFALRTHPGTTSIALQSALHLGAGWTLAGHYTLGFTGAVGGTGESLIGAVSATRSDGFALGLLRGAIWKEGDRVSLTLSQPLRARAGTMTLDLPTDVDESGRVIRSSQALALAPAGRERVAELNYFRPIDRTTGIAASIIVRAHPNHDALAPTERIVSLRISRSF